jgi:hypothetical protein
MYILTPENTSLETSLIPNVTDTLHYCVFDHSEDDYADFQFPPLVFLEEYSKAAVELRIGEYTIQVPSSWAILIGDINCADLEILPVFEFHGRDFNAFVFNPVAGYRGEYIPIEETNIYQEVKWNIPSLQPTHMLAVPLRGGSNPPCVFFAESKNKLPEIIDLGHML